MEKKANWSGFTRAERMTTIDQIEEIVRKAGGWITDHRMFSNWSINFVIEISQGKAASLYEQLSAFLRMDEPASGEHPSAWTGDGEVLILLHVHFIHNQPDIEITVPEVPG